MLFTFAPARTLAVRSLALAQAAAMIPHLDALTTAGAPSPEERDALSEEIDKAERRGVLCDGAARVLRDVYGLNG